jgi:hypothetical protein
MDACAEFHLRKVRTLRRLPTCARLHCFLQTLRVGVKVTKFTHLPLDAPAEHLYNILPEAGFPYPADFDICREIYFDSETFEPSASIALKNLHFCLYDGFHMMAGFCHSDSTADHHYPGFPGCRFIDN